MEDVKIIDVLTSISITIALVVFGLGYLERRSFTRRRDTLDFLLKVIAEDGEINKKHLELAVLINNGKTYENDEVSPEEDKIIIKILDYYDLISDTAINGVIDQEMTILHLGGRMRTTHSTLRSYIEFRRKRLDRPGLYKPFEEFVTKHIMDRHV